MIFQKLLGIIELPASVSLPRSPRPTSWHLEKRSLNLYTTLAFELRTLLTVGLKYLPPPCSRPLLLRILATENAGDPIVQLMSLGNHRFRDD